MNGDFTEVKMHQCKWCKKIFKTNTRHSCKWNPAKHNCLTCKHCVGFKKCADYEGDIRVDASYFVCDLGRDDGGDWNEICGLAYDYWESKCNDYETADCEDFKSHYAEKLNEYEQANAKHCKPIAYMF